MYEANPHSKLFSCRREPLLCRRGSRAAAAVLGVEESRAEEEVQTFDRGEPKVPKPEPKPRGSEVLDDASELGFHSGPKRDDVGVGELCQRSRLSEPTGH